VTPRLLAIDVLVGLAVTGELVCCLGIVVMRDAFARLHYAAASTTIPPFLLAAAVIVEEDWTQPGINALVVAAVLFVLNPVLANATARAARARSLGRVGASADERRSQG
jgi:monovalent cation/proton antiporter MnhG/PhaG subunit